MQTQNTLFIKDRHQKARLHLIKIAREAKQKRIEKLLGKIGEL